MPALTLERPTVGQPSPTSAQAVGPDPQDVGQLVQQNAVIFRVSTGQFGQTRKLESSQYEVDADKAYIRANKILLACPETKAIGSLFSEVRTYLDAWSSPSNFKRGDYLLSVDFLLQVDEAMKVFAGRLKQLKAGLVAVYNERVEAERLKFRSTFNPADYPSAPAVADRYFLAWQYLALATPTNLPPAIAAEQREKLAELWREAGEGVRDLLRANLAEVVGHLQERLTGSSDGKPKVFRDSAVENIREFLASFNARNITNDAECALLAQRVRELLTGVDAQALRDNTALRSQVRDGFQAITGQLDDLMVNKPKRRKFSLGEAD